MRFYEKHILPGLTHLTMGQEQLLSYRRRAVSGVDSGRGQDRIIRLSVGDV